MNVIGIETSCDETAVSVVADGRKVLSNLVFSQIALHRPYGGVVPEIASRNHVETLPGLIAEAVAASGLGWGQLDAVAVTYGPGLASSLLVGLSAAKALALRLKRPLIGINHLQAHLYSAFLSDDAPDFQGICPFVTLTVSGGHTCLVRVEGLGRYRVLGSTIDDAAGEAFDKGANLLGLGYPGGPVIDRIARTGDPTRIRFPRGTVTEPSMTGEWVRELCFSFSGLKTALLYHLKAHPCTAESTEFPHVVASYQEAIVDALVERSRLALIREKVTCFSAVGGVSLNSRLRVRLKEMTDAMGVRLLLSPPKYGVDNAAMIAGLAGTGQGITGESAFLLDAEPSAGFGLG